MQKKHVKWVAIAGGILAALGIVAIIHAAKKAIGIKIDHTKPPPGKSPIPPVKASSQSIFPLKNGSPKNDLVMQLQGLLGVTADGLFGPKTQAALLLKTGKISIASQADFDTIIANLSSAATTSANTTRADKLVSDWQNNSALRMIATSTVSALEVTEDVYGALTATGKKISLIPGYFYNRTDYVVISSTQAGYLKFRVTSGTGMGLYKVDPTKISLS